MMPGAFLMCAASVSERVPRSHSEKLGRSRVFRKKIVHLGSSYTVLEREGKVEGEMGGGGGGEVGKKRGAIRVVDESHVAERNVQVDVGRCRRRRSEDFCEGVTSENDVVIVVVIVMVMNIVIVVYLNIYIHMHLYIYSYI